MTMSFKNVLKNSEIKKLFVEYKNGDMLARDKLIEYNLRLVTFRVYDKFKSFQCDKEDMTSIGIIGLIKAVDTYDISKGIEFATYALRCIDNEILMFFRKKKVENEMVSLDTTNIDNSDETGLTLGDMIRSDEDIESEYIDKEMVKNNDVVVDIILNKLNYRDREIIKMYFGFYDDIEYKQKEIALKMNVSRSHVSRIISHIIKKLRNQLRLDDGYVVDTNEVISNVHLGDVVFENNPLDDEVEIEVDDLFRLVNTSLFKNIMTGVISIDVVNMLINLLNIDIDLGDDFPFKKVEVCSMLRKIMFLYKERLNIYMDDVDKILSSEYEFVKRKQM